jgi:hypothetical protein
LDPKQFRDTDVAVVAYSRFLKMVAVGRSCISQDTGEDVMLWLALVGFAYVGFDPQETVVNLLEPLLDASSGTVEVKMDEEFGGDDTKDLRNGQKARVVTLNAGEKCEIGSGRVLAFFPMPKQGSNKKVFFDFALLGLNGKHAEPNMVHYRQTKSQGMWHSGDHNSKFHPVRKPSDFVTPSQEEFIQANSGENLDLSAQTVHFMGGTPTKKRTLLLFGTSYKHPFGTSYLGTKVSDFRGSVLQIVGPEGSITNLKIEPEQFKDSETDQTVKDLAPYNSILVAVVTFEGGVTTVTNVNKVSSAPNGLENIDSSVFDLRKTFKLDLYQPQDSPGVKAFLASLGQPLQTN